jgi:hypothetical protein
MEDPCTKKQHSKITRELHEYGCWEKRPNSKDPLTKKMLHTLVKMAKTTQPDSKEQAFVDWLVHCRAPHGIPTL